jgi:TetR/AcrR family transcriptional regulator, cholesterol catabolism regulator
MSRPSTTPDDAGTNRTEAKRAARISRIESAAARIFATRGYDAANFGDIAAELDLQGSSLYYYFSSKDELFLRCLSHSAEQVFSRLHAIVAQHSTNPSGALAALVREQVIIEVRDFPEFVPLFFKMHLPDGRLAESVLELRREHARIFESAAAAAQADRHLDPHDVRVWLGVIFGALAYLPEWYDPNGPVGADELADRMSRTLGEPFTR